MIINNDFAEGRLPTILTLTNTQIIRTSSHEVAIKDGVRTRYTRNGDGANRVFSASRNQKRRSNEPKKHQPHQAALLGDTRKNKEERKSDTTHFHGAPVLWGGLLHHMTGMNAPLPTWELGLALLAVSRQSRDGRMDIQEGPTRSIRNKAITDADTNDK